MRLHSHDWMGVTLVVSGSFQDVTEGRSAVCRPLTLVVKPAGAEHDTRVGPDGAMTVYFDFTSSGVRTLKRLGVELDHCNYLMAGLATAPLLSLLQDQACDGTRHIAETMAGLILARQHVSPPVDTITNSMFAIRSLHESTRESAISAQMHPVSFARHFRRTTGIAPSHWRLQSRVAQAASGLADRTESIARVASTAGFADQSHLCRIFRRETGLTPGRFRDLVQAFQTASYSRRR